jgi:hypothetical protein
MHGSSIAALAREKFRASKGIQEEQAMGWVKPKNII